MEDEADAIYFEVDNIQSKMRMSPVSAMRAELLESYLAKLENITEDAESCGRMVNSWKRKYRADPNADLKQEDGDVVDGMKTAFRNL